MPLFTALLLTPRRAVALIITVVPVGALVAIPIFVTHSNVEAQSPCAPYISSGKNDKPAFGTLRGSKSVTGTTSVSGEVSGGVASGGVSVTTSETFNVGTYDMGGGEFWYIRCDNYTEYRIPGERR